MTCPICNQKMKITSRKQVGNEEIEQEICNKCKATGIVTRDLKKCGRIKECTWKRGPDEGN